MKTTLNQDFKTKIFFALSVLLITLISFDLGRIYLLVKYSNIFTLTSIQILKSFLYSIKFDLSIAAIFYCLPFVMMFVPIKSIKYYKFVISVICIMFSVMLVIMIGDLIYFQELKAHITEELFLALSDLRFIIKYSLTRYWLILILLLLFVYCIYRLSVKLFKNFYNPKKISIIKNVVISLIVYGIIFVMIRGNISGMTLGIVDVYKITNNIQEVNLILNGVFTGTHTFVNKETSIKNNIDSEQAYQNIRNILLCENEKFVNDAYPLMRKVTKQDLNKDYNVCIFFLEGWSFKHIDSLNNTSYGVTPYFDKIVSESIVFNNAYAVGTRSIFGLYSIFVGFPLIPGFLSENSDYAYSLELKNLFSIADIFNNKGYYTAYIQTSPIDANKYFGRMAKTNFGMKESYSKEEIPNCMQYEEESFYGYDYDLCVFIDDKVSKLSKEEPFFILAFTGTTHVPFNKTTDEFEKYPRTTEENKYLNSLYYADYSIGQLIEKAKQNDWFDDTIFIFVADHVPNGIEKGNTLKDKFHIPFIIYAPKIFKPQKIEYTVSQLDIIPTLAHMLGKDLKFTALGTNALDEHASHCAFICEGNNIAIVEGGNTMRHNRQTILETNVEKDSDVYKKLEEKILSFDKVVSDSFKYNRWFE